MKRALKIILALLLAVSIVVSLGWYVSVYDRDFARDVLLSQARILDDRGSYTVANWFYSLAYRYAGNDDAIAIEIARQYKVHGNYSKAESTLSNAIADGGSIDLYIALCKTYVEQDKLLDAVTMLDTVADPAIKQQLEALRPAAPQSDPEQGHFNTYVPISLSAADAKIYCSTDREYPSTVNDLYTGPITLSSGQTTLRAVAVNDAGLVSPLSILNYTVTGVIEQVTLSDPAIDREIRQLLGVSAEHKLYSNELWTIESLIVPTDAKSLDDLVLLPFLKELTIRDCSFETLQPLSKLTSLTALVAEDTLISSMDMQTVSGLTTLEYLSLASCEISSVWSLSTLTNLKELDLSGNAIRDLSALAGLSKLEVLNLSHNAVVELEHLSGLTMLTDLDLSYNSVTDISPLGGCSILAQLNVDHNLLKTLSGIDKISNLRSLSCSNNELFNISALSGNALLSELNISGNAISDISVLANLKQLFTLDFSHNQVKKLPAFAKDSILVAINGSSNKLTSLDALAGLANLNVVTMDQNSGIKSVNKLADCEQLIEVSVYGTAVKDVSALTKLDIIVKYSPV